MSIPNSRYKKQRVLSVFSLVMINIIAIDSLRNLPTNAGVGLAIPFYYIIVALIFLLPCVFITAEMATHYPKTGGAYVWVKEAFGPHWGFVTIWLQWIYNVFWYPTILSFIAASIAYLFMPSLLDNKVFMLSIIIGLFTIATLINIFGMKTSSLISTFSAIVGTLIPMFFIIGLGVFWLATGKPLAIPFTKAHFIPSLSNMPNIAFIVIIYFSLMGIEMSAVHAEEVKNPRRDYPRALTYSSLLIIITLILSSTAIAIVVPQSQLNIVSGLNQAFAIFLKPFHLGWLFPVVTICMIVGGFGNMAAWVIGPTKGLVVAAEDGLAPKILRYRNQKGAPVAVLIMQLILVLFICSLFVFMHSFTVSYWILSDLTAQIALMFYMILFLAAIRLRYKTQKDKRAYRIPLGNWGIWICSGIGFIGCLAAVIIGFIPPKTILLHNTFVYELILIFGIFLFAIVPILMNYFMIKRGKINKK